MNKARLRIILIKYNRSNHNNFNQILITKLIFNKVTKI